MEMLLNMYSIYKGYFSVCTKLVYITFVCVLFLYSPRQPRCEMKVSTLRWRKITTDLSPYKVSSLDLSPCNVSAMDFCSQ